MKQLIVLGLVSVSTLFPTLGFGDDHPPTGMVESLQKLVGTAKIKVSSVGPLVVIDGQADKLEELARVEAVTAALNAKSLTAQSLVRLSPEAQGNITRAIEVESGSLSISARFMNNTLIIEGTAENDFQADRTIAIAKAQLRYATIAEVALTPMGTGKGDYPKSYELPGVIIADMMRVRPMLPIAPRKVSTAVVKSVR